MYNIILICYVYIKIHYVYIIYLCIAIYYSLDRHCPNPTPLIPVELHLRTSCSLSPFFGCH